MAEKYPPVVTTLRFQVLHTFIFNSHQCQLCSGMNTIFLNLSYVQSLKQLDKPHRGRLVWTLAMH